MVTFFSQQLHVKSTYRKQQLHSTNHNQSSRCLVWGGWTSANQFQPVVLRLEHARIARLKDVLHATSLEAPRWAKNSRPVHDADLCGSRTRWMDFCVTIVPTFARSFSCRVIIERNRSINVSEVVR